MLFPTFSFFLFFLVVLIFNWWLKRKPNLWRLFLLLVGYFFYALWDLRFLALLLAVSLFNYWGAFLINQARGENRKKFYLALVVGADVLVLAFFKYFNFFRESADVIFNKLGLPGDFLLLHVILPIGLAFYILRAISYNIDVFHQKIRPEKSFLNLALYISFFPQLLSGPILRSQEFLVQLKDGGAKTIENLEENFSLILIGLFKKIVIASYLTMNLVDDVFAVPQNHSQLTVLLAVYAFAIVIYCDFSGYSDMAVGLAGLLGFKSPANFNQPYRALDFRDFWRRWHITFSDWLRDYVYIPLGGGRQSRNRKHFNLLATMFISGLWHGTGIQFVVWGLWHGLGLAVSRVKAASRWEKICSWFITLNAVCFGWIFFRAQNLPNAIDVIWQLFNWRSIGEPINIYVAGVIFFSFLWLILGLGALKPLVALQKRLPILLEALFLAAAVILIVKLGPDIVPPFIYFKF